MGGHGIALCYTAIFGAEEHSFPNFRFEGDGSQSVGDVNQGEIRAMCSSRNLVSGDRRISWRSSHSCEISADRHMIQTLRPIDVRSNTFIVNYTVSKTAMLIDGVSVL
jgi:hypothetical protein